MREDRTFNIRFSSSLINSWDFDLHGAGHLYVQPGKEYFLENCPRSLLDRVVGLVDAMNVTYQLTDNKKGCFNTVNCINYDINDPRSLLGRLRTNRVVIEESVTEPEVVEPEVIDSDGNTTEDFTGEFVTPETPEVETIKDEVIDEPETTEDEVVEPEVEDEVVTEPEVEEEVTISKNDIESMSKPKLEELATSLGIEEVQTKTKKILKSEIINKLGL